VVNKPLTGTLNGGEPEMELRTFNGNVLPPEGTAGRFADARAGAHTAAPAAAKQGWYPAKHRAKGRSSGARPNVRSRTLSPVSQEWNESSAPVRSCEKNHGLANFAARTDVY
jgi:hypothetical protein